MNVVAVTVTVADATVVALITVMSAIVARQIVLLMQSIVCAVK